jgi:hypothetical protein
MKRYDPDVLKLMKVGGTQSLTRRASVPAEGDQDPVGHSQGWLG